MTKQTCKMCEKDFEMGDDDLSFYEKIKAPNPNYCPECRVKRRLAFRNERTLYRRNCSMSGKSMISIYPENTPFPVYDQHIWWGDDWDASSFGQDYDPNRKFFDQYLELRNKVPRISLLNINGVDSDYVNNSEDNKSCYLIFAAQKNEDSMYGRLVYRNRFSVDSDFIMDSELCYECIDCRKCYNCLFIDNSEATTDSMLSYDLKDCQNCILCTNLRHKKFHILNKPVSKEEFETKKKEILSSYSNLQKAKEEYETIRQKAIVKFSHQVRCYSSTGDYMYNCHEVYSGFDTENSKNCKYTADAEGTIDCWDMNNTYYKPELNLDVMGALQTFNVKHCIYTMYTSHAEYSDSLHNCENCFGCIGLKKKKYCILNKQYGKEEYEKLKKIIIENMKKEGTYGDFLPPSLSPFGYNETLGFSYYPMNQEEAVKKGFNWQEQTTGTYGKETIKESEMPSGVEEISDSITSEILVCKDCKKNFKITEAELSFYKRMGLPLPHKDFECRHQDRMKKRNPRQLWPRSCMCKNENHHNHDGGICKEKFETTYSPDRKEIIYCESCYQQEVE
jgi:hypothetical protein